jgi:tripartite-type tricarboxylate transporter receptor subunit TctC
MQARMKASGARFSRNSPDEFAKFQKSDIQKWARVIKNAGIVAD